MNNKLEFMEQYYNIIVSHHTILTGYYLFDSYFSSLSFENLHTQKGFRKSYYSSIKAYTNLWRVYDLSNGNVR